MKVRTDGREFADAVAWAHKTVGTHFMPALAGVVIEADEGSIALSATDMETSARATIPAAVDEPGKTLVPRALLATVAGRFGEGKAEIVTDERLSIRCGRIAMTLRTLDVADFPDLPAVEGEGRPIPWARVAEAVAPCASKDFAGNATLGGVHIGDGHFVATDSYHMSILDDAAVSGDVSVPPGLFHAAPEDASLVVDETYVAAVGSDRTVVSRLIEGRFPNVVQMWPGTEGVTLVVERKALVDALGVVIAVTGRDKSRGEETNFPACRFSAVGSDLTIEGAADGDEVSETVDVFASEDLSFAVNPAFMLTIARAHTSEHVTISQGAKRQPIAVTSEDEALRTLVMPIAED